MIYNKNRCPWSSIATSWYYYIKSKKNNGIISLYSIFLWLHLCVNITFYLNNSLYLFHLYTIFYHIYVMDLIFIYILIRSDFCQYWFKRKRDHHCCKLVTWSLQYSCKCLKRWENICYKFEDYKSLQYSCKMLEKMGKHL